MKNSGLVIHPTGCGSKIFWYNDKQVELCSVIKLIEKDSDGNWVKYEDMGTTLACFPNFVSGSRVDAFDDSIGYLSLYKKFDSSSFMTIAHGRKAKKIQPGQLGVIRYVSIHDEKFNELVEKSNYEGTISYAEKSRILSEISSEIEEEMIKELVSNYESCRTGKKPRKRV